MPEDAAGFKYGALVFSPPEGPNGSTPMFCSKETFEGDILSLFPDSEHGHWREWIGSVAWEKIRRAGRVVVARIESRTPGVLNAEDERLRNQMRNAWAAFLLTGANHSEHPAWVISGQAVGVAAGTGLLTIRSGHVPSSGVRRVIRFD